MRLFSKVISIFFADATNSNRHLTKQSGSVECYGTAVASELSKEPFEAIRLDSDDGVLPDDDDVSTDLSLEIPLIFNN